jgi:CheY-like chemotaxis protein
MKKKVNAVVVIGLGLTFLYAMSSLVFLQYVHIPGFEHSTKGYSALFGALCLCSVAVVMLKEWGRQLFILLNAVMLISVGAEYIPKIDLLPLGYLFLNGIVLLYFTQGKIKRQFHKGRHVAWEKSILIVDDDEVAVRMLRPALLSHGYAVLTAETGADGLQIVQSQKPDMILLDVLLPDINGREVCRQLKEARETRDIPVVFMTAKDSLEDIQAETEVGGIGHITKPVEIEVLIQAVEKILMPEKKRTK